MKKLLLLSLVSAVSLHAAEQDFSKGTDFTGLTSFAPANLNNLVDAAVPATKRGLVIVQTNTPDTVNYPRFTNYLWLDINYTPALLKSYATGSWVTATIGAGSIAAANLAANAVIAGKIDANAIFTTNLNDNVISSAKIIAGAITGGKYFAGSISNADIAIGAVNSATILDGSIATVDIAAGAITGPLLSAGAVSNANIAAGAVYGSNIVTGTITSTNLADQAVGLTNLVRGTARQTLRVNAGETAYVASTGGVGSMAYSNITAYTTNAATPAYDDTIPDAAEGTQIATLSITPQYSASILHVQAKVFLGVDSGGYAAAFVLNDSDTVSAVGTATVATTTHMQCVIVDYYVAAGGTSAQTWKLRAGGNVVTYVNGQSTGPERRYGGKLNSTFSITEIIQ